MKPSFKDWLMVCAKIGFLSFGGSGRILLFQEAVVEKNKWLSQDEFQEILTLCQFLPGPNLINVCVYLGNHFLGRTEAFIGLLALSTPGALLGVAVLLSIPIHNPQVVLLFQGLSIGSIITFIIFVLKLFGGLKGKSEAQDFLRNSTYVFRLLIALTVGAASLMGFSLVPVVLLGAAVSLLVEFLL